MAEFYSVLESDPMFNHVMVGANDIEKSKKFYDNVLGVLGVAAGKPDAKGRIFYVTQDGSFAISKPLDGQPASGANGGTIGFRASSPEQVGQWHALGLKCGGVTCEDPPGVRQPAGIYLAYLRDPAGNKICVVHRPAVR
jgi:catechol 2,3-dioxygenase-like lactoylglutathione lyase family enzyme